MLAVARAGFAGVGFGGSCSAFSHVKLSKRSCDSESRERERKKTNNRRFVGGVHASRSSYVEPLVHAVDGDTLDELAVHLEPSVGMKHVADDKDKGVKSAVARCFLI